MKANWIALYGRVEVTTDGTIRHVPLPAQEGTPPQVPFTLARSNLEFGNGTVSFEVQIKSRTLSANLALTMDTRLNTTQE